MPKQRDYTKAYQELDEDHKDELTKKVYDIKDLDIKPRKSKTGLTVAEDGAITAGYITISKVGLTFSSRATEQDWQNVWEMMQRFKTSMQWILGDWIVYGEGKFGRTYQELAELTGTNEKTLRNYASVCRRIHLSLRRDTLSFGHHALIADKAKDEDEALRILEYASENNLSIRALREYLKIKQDKPIPVIIKKTEGLGRVVTKKRWEALEPFQRQQQYEYLLSIKEKMERWGFGDE